MSVNFYALGHKDDDDPMFHVGKLSGGVFTWAMDRLRTEAVLSGLGEKHCRTCTCTETPDDGSVVEDENGARYTWMDFALVLVEATAEDRTLVGRVFF